MPLPISFTSPSRQCEPYTPPKATPTPLPLLAGPPRAPNKSAPRSRRCPLGRATHNRSSLAYAKCTHACMTDGRPRALLLLPSALPGLSASSPSAMEQVRSARCAGRARRASRTASRSRATAGSRASPTRSYALEEQSTYSQHGAESLRVGSYIHTYMQ